MERYLIYSNTGLTSKQVGLTAEIIENIKDKGEEVKVVMCDNKLDNCYFNRSHNIMACASCQTRTRKLLSLAGITGGEYLNLKRDKKVDTIKIPSFDSLDSLINYEYNGINIGRGVASSLVSYLRDNEVTSEKYGELIDIELRKAINVLLNFKDIISEYKPTKVYIFNGRFAEVAPVLELAKQNEIDFYTMESGAGTNYQLFKNNMPHSISLRTEMIEKLWASESPDVTEKRRQASEWFESKRGGKEDIVKSFTNQQTKGEIPKNFDDKKINIVIFNSSEDERKALKEWQTPLFNTQNDVIQELTSYYQNNDSIHFYLRIHPNLKNVKSEQLESIRSMNSNNLTIIEAESTIDSYTMMDICDKVLVFVSTMGIEATFWGKTSVLYGKAGYQNLDATYWPSTFEELTSLLETRGLAPKDKEGAYKFAYFLRNFGKKSRYFKFDGLSGSAYKNHKIRVFYLNTIKYLLRYSYNYHHWKKMHKLYFREKFRLFSAIKKYV